MTLRVTRPYEGYSQLWLGSVRQVTRVCFWCSEWFNNVPLCTLKLVSLHGLCTLLLTYALAKSTAHTHGLALTTVEMLPMPSLESLPTYLI